MIKVVQIDTNSQESIKVAAQSIAKDLGEYKLYALVNNAGIYNGSGEEIMRTNLYGPKLMCDAFTPLIDPTCGRVVNMSSGMGPGYVSKCNDEQKKILIRSDVTWEQVV